jgi:hypothetical protein
MMQLSCQACGAPIRADDMNLESMVAKCRHCDAVFSFADRVGPPAAVTATRKKGIVPQPKNIVVDEWGGELRLTRRWFHPALFFLLFFCIAWDGFLVFWYSMALGDFGPPGASGLLFIVFPIAHVAIGVGLTYLVIGGFLNKTVITAGRGELRVRHGPIPWRGNHSLLVDDVAQLYCGRSENKHQNAGVGVRKVNALMKDGRKIVLVSFLHDPDEARFIEYKLESYLGITDHAVAGEEVA